MKQFKVLTVEEMQMINGGSFWKKLWKGIKEAAKWIWDNAKKIQTFIDGIIKPIFG